MANDNKLVIYLIASATFGIVLSVSAILMVFALAKA
jgi:hypothetical protein